MDRRTFLKSVVAAGATLVVKTIGATTVLTERFEQTADAAEGEAALGTVAPDLVAVMGGTPAAMFQKAIAEFGGISTFVKKGQKVVVKPNIGWDKTPDLAGNTNPELVGEIVKQCMDAGAKEVVVFDNTCDEWQKCYKNSGIDQAVKKAGGRMMPANNESYYREIKLPRAKIMKKAKIHQAILDCDVWINVPVLKNHGGAKMTMSMKNLMGIVWDRRYFHNNGLQQCIADMCTLDKKPALNIVDAYRVMKDNGPRGKSAADVVSGKALFMSRDIVAVDTAAAKFFNQIRTMPLEDIGHLANGQAHGLGTMNIDKLNVKRIRM
ncbi:MAG: DUF362 domain-containing protein [Bacteroidales bacterium]|jgi:uncharacterized protein (DUF362 family)|nr:DUF362 domain-containing protein [Bacteroidales bacterium]